jgi:hypothetical protein
MLHCSATATQRLGDSEGERWWPKRFGFAKCSPCKILLGNQGGGAGISRQGGQKSCGVGKKCEGSFWKSGEVKMNHRIQATGLFTVQTLILSFHNESHAIETGDSNEFVMFLKFDLC